MLLQVMLGAILLKPDKSYWFYYVRLCAVFGGIYCLKRTVSEVRFTNTKSFESIKCGEQEIRSKDIVFGHGAIDGLNVSDGLASGKL